MESVRFPVLLTAVVSAVLLLAPHGYADQVTVFSLTTVYQPPQAQQPDGTASGTNTIDTTTGAVEAINLSFAGEPGSTTPSTFSDVQGARPNAFVEINESWRTPQDAFFDVEIALPVDTLVGYAGGSICTTAEPCYGGSTSGFSWGNSEMESYSAGQLTPTPEPATLTLFATGVLGLIVFLFRKHAFPRRFAVSNAGSN
jgi:hypothetical protein